MLFYGDTTPGFREKNKVEAVVLREDTDIASFFFELPIAVRTGDDRVLRFSCGISGFAYRLEEFAFTDREGKVLFSCLDDFRVFRHDGTVCTTGRDGMFHYYSNGADPELVFEIPERVFPHAERLLCRVRRCAWEAELFYVPDLSRTNTVSKKALLPPQDSPPTKEPTLSRLPRPIRFATDILSSTRAGMLLQKAVRSLLRDGVKTTWEKMRGTLHRVRAGLDMTLLEKPLSEIRAAPPLQAMNPGTRKIAVIIPVYNGLSHLQKLTTTLFEHTPEDSCAFLFLDDASPDTAITPLLQSLCVLDKRVTIDKNPENLGFVKTVNKAISRCSDADYFVLLNTDTEVPAGWLSRLITPMLRDASVATVTPFSNGATIFSMPVSHENNREFADQFSTFEIDALLQTCSLPATALDAPSGVGFCMAVNAAVWHKIGPLDEASFEKGYGEEVDWCMRAARSGFRHQIAPNLYVAHFHGGSFDSAEKQRLIESHQELLDKRYPEFFRKHQAYSAGNCHIWDAIRISVPLRLTLTPENRPVLIFDHDWGGGANEYRTKRIAEYLLEGRAVLLLTPGVGIVNATLFFGKFHFPFHLRNLSMLSDPLFENIQEILVNELVSWTDIYGRHILSSVRFERLIGEILQLKTRLHAVMRIMMHDFFLACPHINVFHVDGHYCDPDKSGTSCETCIREHRADTKCYTPISRDLTALNWRNASQRLIEGADELRFFSRNTIEIMKQVFELKPTQIHLVPHAELVNFQPIPSFRKGTVTIGVVGAISQIKGAGFLVNFARRLKEIAPSARIVIIGIIAEKNLPDNIHVHGPYQQKEIPALLLQYGVNIGFLPALWPETFSYVTQELMMLELPLVCFNLGAPADRIGPWHKGRIIPSITPEATWDTIQKLFQDHYQNG